MEVPPPTLTVLPEQCEAERGRVQELIVGETQLQAIARVKVGARVRISHRGRVRITGRVRVS